MTDTNFEAEMNRINHLFEERETFLCNLTIKVDFQAPPYTFAHGELLPYGFRIQLGFQKIGQKFRFTANNVPVNSIPVLQKIYVAEHLAEFEELYITYLNALAARAKKAGKKP